MNTIANYLETIRAEEEQLLLDMLRDYNDIVITEESEEPE